MLIPNLETFLQQILFNVLSTRPFTYPVWYWNSILSTNTITTMRYIWDYAINLMDEIGNPLSQPGPRFTNSFSIAIEIRWKFLLTLISILTQWSLQFFVHGKPAVLSWHVQKFVRSDGQQRNHSKVKFPSNLNCGQKYLVKRAPVVITKEGIC